MIPSVFVSSTVRDLHHLRDSLRDCINDLGYNPVMSDYGEIGYLPELTAETSCYNAMISVQLAILIIGKRYSEPASNDVSVTENEYRTALKKKIPIITLVDREVMAYKRVFDSNKEPAKKKVNFPGMDRPELTFAFIDSVTRSPYNNGILEYGTTSEARRLVKQQLAHLFASLLARHYDPVQAEIKDVIAEIHTLRRDIGKPTQHKSSREFLAVYRFLLAEKNSSFRSLLEALNKDLGDLVDPLMKSPDWFSFLKRIKVSHEIVEDEKFYKPGPDSKLNPRLIMHSLPRYTSVQGPGFICRTLVTMEGKIFLTTPAKIDFDAFVKAAHAAVDPSNS
jgi:hypothetical protein